MERNEILAAILRKQPKIHCLTNPVTMNDVANILLAAGGSAVMAQDEQEAAEITTFCQGTLLNTGVPDEAKIRACILAGKRANQLDHPVVLDPVGVGGSSFRRRELRKLLDQVHPAVVRCNQEEAAVLCSFHSEQETHFSHGGVESSLHMDAQNLTQLARTAARLYNCTFFITGKIDIVSEGKQTILISGGDPRLCRITGGGCMLSALCALFCCSGASAFEAASTAGQLWKEISEEAGKRTDQNGGGIGQFHMSLMDMTEQKIYFSAYS